jgi:hypothetical protein
VGPAGPLSENVDESCLPSIVKTDEKELSRMVARGRTFSTFQSQSYQPMRVTEGGHFSSEREMGVTQRTWEDRWERVVYCLPLVS